MPRSHEWLRSFLHLGARADKEGVPARDIERQEDTVLRALDILEERPGVVLADEVGMGKTFEALGVAAAFRHGNPKSKVVVVTPGPDLNAKWHAEFASFKEMYDFRGEVGTARSLADFVDAVKSSPIVIAPITMFQTGRSQWDHAYILALYVHWKGLDGRTLNAMLTRAGLHKWERPNVTADMFLGVVPLAKLERRLRRAFVARRGAAASVSTLDGLYKTFGLPGFDDQKAVKRAIQYARFALIGELVPDIDLLIVDEAHKYKNHDSLRTRGMRRVFGGRFDKALFLTATPFQLDVKELGHIFNLFSGARSAPADLQAEIRELLRSVANYQGVYDSLQAAWCRLDPISAREFSTRYDRRDPTLAEDSDPQIAEVVRHIDCLRALKCDHIEPGFRRWMIRSLKDDKRAYRRHERVTVRTLGADSLPFLIYERFIAELFRQRRRTHKAAAEINMVSSFAAAKAGELLNGENGDMPESAVHYRELLRDVLALIDGSDPGHPKLNDVKRDALNAAAQGEKTLIFCSRVATLTQLANELGSEWERGLVERWRKVYPEATADTVFDRTEQDESRQRGRHSLLQARFKKPQDALYLALREPYLRTVVPISGWSAEWLDRIVSEANQLLATVRVNRSSAERRDYQVAKRCVEQAAVRGWCKERGPFDEVARHPEQAIIDDAVARLTDERFLQLGLDLVQDEHEGDTSGEHIPRWLIDERTVRLVLGDAKSLWSHLAEPLERLPIELRVRLVEQLGDYLRFKHSPFLPELLAEAQSAGLAVEPVGSASLLTFMSTFWTTDAGRRWIDLFREFVEYFAARGDEQQTQILDGPLRNISFARHTKDGEGREKLREAFNTPLFPMVLIANEVMQEGLDLHKHCRRIVHHDLVWNPAQLEQRTGRIDRLGSLTNRLREADPGATLDVLYPVIERTIDQRLYRTVKTREKWLEFLLGAAPNFTDYADGEEEPAQLPDRLAEDLAVHLGPVERSP